MTVSVYGYSDDLIGVEGDVSAEFYTVESDDDDGGNLIACSDGTILRIVYGPGGVWRITPVVRGTAELSVQMAPEGDESSHSDLATLNGPIAWVVHGIGWAQVTTS